ncbi:hypothetical protein CFP56_012338 [Quercus suber]|uniref:Oligopeptidase A N-terminal domain-containing protein n=1 Tax=Quercus suber TaxID=58331 RepID=A0AAW0M3M6_QUESU
MPDLRFVFEEVQGIVEHLKSVKEMPDLRFVFEEVQPQNFETQQRRLAVVQKKNKKPEAFALQEKRVLWHFE